MNWAGNWAAFRNSLQNWAGFGLVFKKTLRVSVNRIWKPLDEVGYYGSGPTQRQRAGKGCPRPGNGPHLGHR